MNLIKATIATAAVITCCLGNEMPAHALSETNKMLNTAQTNFNVGNEQLGCHFTNLALIADSIKPSASPQTINKLYGFASRCGLSIY